MPRETEVLRATLTKDMRTHSFVDKRRTLLPGECDVPNDHVLHSVSAESITPRIRKQELRWLSS